MDISASSLSKNSDFFLSRMKYLSKFVNPFALFCDRDRLPRNLNLSSAVRAAVSCTARAEAMLGW